MPAARLRRETSQCDVLWNTWLYDDKFSFLYLNMDKALNNSTLRKVAYIWRIEKVQIDATKVWKDANSSFLVMFSLQSSSLLLKLPDHNDDDEMMMMMMMMMMIRMVTTSQWQASMSIPTPKTQNNNDQPFVKCQSDTIESCIWIRTETRSLSIVSSSQW